MPSQFLVPPVYKRRPSDMEPIPPLQNYHPQNPKPDEGIPQGQMADLIARDGGDFADWMKDYGGYHFDDANMKFSHDGEDKPGPTQMLSNWLKEGYINPGNALMKAAEPILAVGKAGAAAYPKFKEEANAAPGKALQDMADYERVNPLGSALSFTGNVVAGKTARGFKQAEEMGRVFGGAVDKLPRFEINDAASTLKSKLSMGNYAEIVKKIKGGQIKLSDILDHPELFEQYPELKDMVVDASSSMGSHENGFYNPEHNVIGINPNLAGDDARSALLHEAQHAIQEREGFAKGGSPEMPGLNREQQFEQSRKAYEDTNGDNQLLAELFDKPHTATQQIPWEALSEREKLGWLEAGRQRGYQKLAGEAESRNVQGRMNMNDAERKAKPFNSTFDVPVEQQIMRMKSSPATSGIKDFLTKMERMRS